MDYSDSTEQLSLSLFTTVKACTSLSRIHGLVRAALLKAGDLLVG